jgi:hypothetical protein
MKADHDRLFELTSQLRRGPFGKQKALLELLELCEAATIAQALTAAKNETAPADCPVCARRREQTRLRVAAARKRAKKRKSK